MAVHADTSALEREIDSGGLRALRADGRGNRSGGGGSDERGI